MLPTFEQCQEMCDKNPNKAFYRNTHTVNGRTVHVFDYFLAQYKDFVVPFEGATLGGFELRGLTFVEKEDQTYQRFILLHKFFNVNQNEDYLYDVVSKHEIESVQDKADGSVIRFIDINGEIIAKSKTSFVSQQADFANKLLSRDENLRAFVRATLDQGVAAIFEFVSPNNQIVLSYAKTELILLQMRDEMTGAYLSLKDHELVKKYQPKMAEDFTSRQWSWQTLMDMQKTVEGVEGWIVTLKNGMMAKVKTEWYMRRHGVMTTTLVKEDLVIDLILKEEIDDAMSQLKPDDARYINAERATAAVFADVHKKVEELLVLVDSLEGVTRETKGQWFEKHKSSPFIQEANAVFRLDKELRRDEALKRVKKHIGRNTFRQMQARAYLESLGVSLLPILMTEEDG